MNFPSLRTSGAAFLAGGCVNITYEYVVAELLRKLQSQTSPSPDMKRREDMVINLFDPDGDDPVNIFLKGGLLGFGLAYLGDLTGLVRVSPGTYF